MNKIKFTVLFYIITLVLSCICPNNGTTTKITIENAATLLYSFDENGIFPFLEEFNREELGILVAADSTTREIVALTNFGIIQSGYACDDPDERFYDNAIDSITVFTLFDYNNNYKSGDSFVSNLNYVSGFDGETFEINNLIDDQGIDFLFKFKEPPTKDTLQFKVTGRIIDKGDFELYTKKIILKE